MIASFCLICASRYSRLLEPECNGKCKFNKGEVEGEEDEDEVDEFEEREDDDEDLLRRGIFQGGQGGQSLTERYGRKSPSLRRLAKEPSSGFLREMRSPRRGDQERNEGEIINDRQGRRSKWWR